MSQVQSAKKRPEFRNVNFYHAAFTYRLPLAGVVSVLHRVSGVVMFLLLPFILWMLDSSLRSEISFEIFKSTFNSGLGFVPGWFFKFIALAIIWSYLHHLCAGLRHLLMDLNHDIVTKEFGKTSAVAVLFVSLGLTFVLGLKLFGFY